MTVAEAVAWVRQEATVAPADMVAVYAELALRHLDAQHDGHPADCNPCHEALTR